MSGFIQREDCHQATLFPESLDEYVAADSPVRVIDVFVDDLAISGLGFRTEPAETGRPAYHPRTMPKIYIYGYLNRIDYRFVGLCRCSGASKHGHADCRVGFSQNGTLGWYSLTVGNRPKEDMA